MPLARSIAALDVLAGKVIGDCYKRHRHQEFLRFLRRINREFPGKRPTSSICLNLIERRFGELTIRRIRRDS